MAKNTMQIPELIEAIYATIDDPDCWPQVLFSLGQAVSARKTLLFLSDAEQGKQEALVCTETPGEMVNDFINYYAAVNLLAEPCDRMFPDESVRFSHWAVLDREFERSEFYLDFFKPLDLHYSVGLKAPTAHGASLYLSAQRSKRDGGFTPDEGRMWQMLLPHLRRAVTVRARLDASASQGQAAEEALLRYSARVIGLDARGTVCYASQEAEKMLRTEDVLAAREGRLRAVHPASNTAFQLALKAVLGFDKGFQMGQHGAVTLRGKEGRRSVQIVLLPGNATGFNASLKLAALLYVRDPSQEVTSRKFALQALYSLTATEVRIADLLLAGKEVKEIADVLLMSNDAIRFHVKRVLAKTGVHRQAELIRLMLEFPGTSA